MTGVQERRVDAYRNAVVEHWHNYALSRFVADLASGEIVGQVDRDRVPTTFWKSDVMLHLEDGVVAELAVERQRTVRLLVLAGKGAVDPAVAVRKAPGQDRTPWAAR